MKKLVLMFVGEVAEGTVHDDVKGALDHAVKAHGKPAREEDRVLCRNLLESKIELGPKPTFLSLEKAGRISLRTVGKI